MINLDERYHSYLHGSKRMTIDGVKERVIGYGWSDNGKEITGHYVTTENYQLQYDKEGNFLNMEARLEVKNT